MTNLSAQESDIPYHTIPDYPNEYNAGTVAARMVDGLGFRYYWATEGLRPEDIQFSPSEESRSVQLTIDHIYGMTLMLASVVNQSPREMEEKMSFEEKREKTLRTLFDISNALREMDANDLEKLVMKRGDREIPFWNMINGPIADCLWHCGQIVSYRRLSGNPFNSNVSLFDGAVNGD
ncbi:hypothetical protein [Halocola ammonii]